MVKERNRSEITTDIYVYVSDEYQREKRKQGRRCEMLEAEEVESLSTLADVTVVRENGFAQMVSSSLATVTVPSYLAKNLWSGSPRWVQWSHTSL